uniref:GCR1_C domain-containing protein n=1 Tax=Panagrellus redivivus TaxID=6233 RepID=A0A7E4W984_PANRE
MSKESYLQSFLDANNSGHDSSSEAFLTRSTAPSESETVFLNDNASSNTSKKSTRNTRQRKSHTVNTNVPTTSTYYAVPVQSSHYGQAQMGGSPDSSLQNVVAQINQILNNFTNTISDITTRLENVESQMRNMENAFENRFAEIGSQIADLHECCTNIMKDDNMIRRKRGAVPRALPMPQLGIFLKERVEHWQNSKITFTLPVFKLVIEGSVKKLRKNNEIIHFNFGKYVGTRQYHGAKYADMQKKYSAEIVQTILTKEKLWHYSSRESARRYLPIPQTLLQSIAVAISIGCGEPIDISGLPVDRNKFESVSERVEIAVFDLISSARRRVFQCEKTKKAFLEMPIVDDGDVITEAITAPKKGRRKRRSAPETPVKRRTYEKEVSSSESDNDVPGSDIKKPRDASSELQF